MIELIGLFAGMLTLQRKLKAMAMGDDEEKADGMSSIETQFAGLESKASEVNSSLEDVVPHADGN